MTFSDRWRDSYDAWKLATPPEYDGPACDQCGAFLRHGACPDCADEEEELAAHENPAGMTDDEAEEWWEEMADGRYAD